jgi:hypothetical protein
MRWSAPYRISLTVDFGVNYERDGFYSQKTQETEMYDEPTQFDVFMLVISTSNGTRPESFRSSKKAVLSEFSANLP